MHAATITAIQHFTEVDLSDPTLITKLNNIRKNFSMKLQVFSIYDSKAEAFIQPWYSQTLGTAIRSFEQAVNTPDHEFAKFAGDYTLFHLGEFCQHTGKFSALPAHINLGVALSFIKVPNG